MELTQLKQFKVIADTENISEASNMLYVTQPALSNSLNKLEKELGVRLFDRAGKKISLNDNGKVVLDTVNNILEMLDKMENKLSNSAATNNIRICTAIVLFIYYIFPIFNVENPDIKTFPQVVSQDEIYTQLKKNSFDCAIISYPLDPDEFNNVEICTDYAGCNVMLSDPLSKKAEISTKDLENRSFATFLNQNPLSNLAKEYLAKVPGIKYIYNGDLTSNQLYIKNTNVLSIQASTAEFIMPTSENRKYIPFEKKANIKLTYYFTYKKDGERAADLKRMAEWLTEYFENYNKEYN